MQPLTSQRLLTEVAVQQPDDPMGYFHEEITKIKTEIQERNVNNFDLPTIVLFVSLVSTLPP